MALFCACSIAWARLSTMTKGTRLATYSSIEYSNQIPPGPMSGGASKRIFLAPHCMNVRTITFIFLMSYIMTILDLETRLFYFVVIDY